MSVLDLGYAADTGATLTGEVNFYGADGIPGTLSGAAVGVSAIGVSGAASNVSATLAQVGSKNVYLLTVTISNGAADGQYVVRMSGGTTTVGGISVVDSTIAEFVVNVAGIAPANVTQWLGVEPAGLVSAPSDTAKVLRVTANSRDLADPGLSVLAGLFSLPNLQITGLTGSAAVDNGKVLSGDTMDGTIASPYIAWYCKNVAPSLTLEADEWTLFCSDGTAFTIPGPTPPWQLQYSTPWMYISGPGGGVPMLSIPAAFDASGDPAGAAAIGGLTQFVSGSSGPQQFTAEALKLAPTGPTYNIAGIVPIGGLVPLPLVLQQSSSIALTIPLLQAISESDTVKFVVTSMVNRTTILWEATAVVNAGGASVNVTGDDTNTQTPPANGWYWYLIDTTTKLRIGEGPLALDAGPLVT